MKKVILFISLILMVATFGTVHANTSNSGNLIPEMTSNTSPSGIISASSSYGPDHQPVNAFSDTSKYGWVTANSPTGWLAYEFENPVVVNKYSVAARRLPMDAARESPRDWKFEGWDGNQWIVLDTQQDISGWLKGTEKEFSFSNTNKYKKYRINVTKNNGYEDTLSIGRLKMMFDETEPEPNPEPEPEPEPEPNPEPEVPSENTGDRAILVVTMITDLEKEFDLSMKEVDAFINWYESSHQGTGTATFAINNHDNNKGPFKNRKDYIIFDKVLTFEVSEY